MFRFCNHVVDSISVLGFAFTTNYYVAVALRFVWGFCDGHYSLIKTLIADYSNEKTLSRNSSYMFLSVSLVKFIYLVFMIYSSIAPLIGGYLSNPDNISEWIKNLLPIVQKKHFCFPFIICFIGLFICIKYHICILL